MGVGASGTHGEARRPAPKRPMRCRTTEQVPKCFRQVKCPYVPGETVYGEFGAINYTLVGPADGELVVCFHGLNGSRMLFQDSAAYIARSGNFRVLTFDLYGHGLSNAPPVDLMPCASCSTSCRASCCAWNGPRGRYDLDFFVDQTDELLWLIGLENEPMNLMGFSLGGAVAVAFAKRFPSRVRRLVAISPSGFIPKVPPLYYVLKAVWCCLVPLAPHVLCTCWYKKERFARSLRAENQDMDDPAIHSLWSRFVWQLFVKRGVASATLVNWFNLTELYEHVGRNQRPVLLVWGERDNLNPVATVGKKVKALFSNAKLLEIPRAGHIALCDRPREVVPRIVRFLQLPVNSRMDSADLEPVALPAPRPDDQTPEPEEYDDEKAEQVALRAENMPVALVLGHTEQDVALAGGQQLRSLHL